MRVAIIILIVFLTEKSIETNNVGCIINQIYQGPAYHCEYGRHKRIPNYLPDDIVVSRSIAL